MSHKSDMESPVSAGCDIDIIAVPRWALQCVMTSSSFVIGGKLTATEWTANELEHAVEVIEEALAHRGK